MNTMLKRLRIQLTLFYFIAALSLVLLLGGGSYLLLRHYLYSATDLAVQVKMALVLQQYGFSLPPELAQAEQNWLQNRGQALQPPTRSATSSEKEEEEAEEHSATSSLNHYPGDEAYDEELAPVFVLPLNASSDLMPSSNLPQAPIAQDRAAATAALANGSDLRTVRLSDGSRARLLTYRVEIPGGPTLIQVGRLLRDQDRVLSQYLFGLTILAAFGATFLGLGSWWLSGRTLGPAQQAWSQQQAFVSNASHELRTPLTLIRATADYALRSQPPQEQVENLKEILGECDYMNGLVDDLLLLSRLDANRLELTRQPVQISILFQEVKDKFEKLADGKEVQLFVDNDRGSVWGDPVRMRQVLFILLDNSLRFTPPGGVIRLDSQPSGKQRLLLVSDNGRGIPAEDLPHVFERFYQVKNTKASDSRSNGLGLSIAKSLVEAQGGWIAIDSQEGEGATAILSLEAAD
jgi:signal transduction histidine kinase